MTIVRRPWKTVVRLRWREQISINDWYCTNMSFSRPGCGWNPQVIGKIHEKTCWWREYNTTNWLNGFVQEKFGSNTQAPFFQDFITQLSILRASIRGDGEAISFSCDLWVKSLLYWFLHHYWYCLGTMVALLLIALNQPKTVHQGCARLL